MPQSPNTEAIKHALVDTSVVAVGYIPLGIAFGFLFQKLGVAWYLASLMSIFVFAGSAQFIAITVLSAHGSLWSLVLSTALVNLRHIFYGISFVGKFPEQCLLKWYMIFSLTDESYSILTSTSRPYSNTYAFWVMLISQGHWVLGTVIGSLLGCLVDQNFNFLEFSLTALFIIMALEQVLKIKNAFPFVAAILSTVICYCVVPDFFLFAAIALSLLVLIAYYRFLLPGEP